MEKLTFKDACKALGCGPTTLYRLVKERELGSLRLANKIFFKPEHVQEYLSRNEVKPVERND